MKQVLHIFAKDARQLWVEIVISLAIVAAFAYIYPSSWLQGNGLYAVAGGAFVPALAKHYLGGMLKLLVPVSWWLLIARVVHAEALVGDRQFWLTRPYEWKKLLGAKALFLLVFLYLPILLAQCLLLLQAGFYPLSLVPGLLFNLVLITGIVVLPLFAIASVTATFARVTVTLLAGLVCFIGYVAISLVFSDNASVPFNDFSLPLTLVFCAAVVILQYAARRVWISRSLLLGLAILLALGGSAIPDSSVMRPTYPRSQQAPIQLALLRDGPNPASADLLRANLVQLRIPLQVSGVAEGYALIPDAVEVTAVAANGSTWTSPWRPVYNEHYLPGTSDSWVTVVIGRAFFDQARSMPVTLHFTYALTQVRAGSSRSLPLSRGNFPVPEFGVCSSDPPWMESQIFGIACRFALRQPRLTYIRTFFFEGGCGTSQSGPENGVPGDGWAGNLGNEPADFGITSVSSQPIGLSNPTRIDGPKTEPRGLCPGTPITFTQYNLVNRFQYEFTIPDFHFPAYHPDPPSINGASSFSISAR